MPQIPSLLAEEGRIDLEIESIQIQPPRPTSEDPITVVSMVRNNGSEFAQNFYVGVAIFQKGKLIKEIDQVPVLSRLPRMGAGLSVPIAIGKLPGGNYEAVVNVDPENQIRETDKKNNQLRKTFQVESPIFSQGAPGKG